MAMVAMFKAWETSRPFPVSGSSAAAGPVFTLATGRLATSAATTQAVRTALQTGVAAVTTASSAIIVGFAALLFPSPLGNGESRELNVPLSDLVPDNLHAWSLSLSDYEPSSLQALSIPLSYFTPEHLDDLRSVAAANGRVRLPVAIGSRTAGNTTELFVAATNSTTVPDGVPVRLATFDPIQNVYRSYNPDAPSIGMTWTPIVRPDNASTTLPVMEPNIAVYDGTTLTALEGRTDAFPEFDRYSFGGFVTVFPVESGIPPLYVVFSSPYEGATTTGKYSGRAFNPDRAGGPIIDLNWRTAVITRGGIDAVKLHIARLDQSDANDIMIDRLEKILGGYLEITETDQRYYTHELRELERFRAMELADDFKPEGGSPQWNNAHTATLEDYRLGSSDALLYSEEALDAANNQIDRIYKDLLKGEFQ
ncbi:hypothetical protein BK665_10345 [Pseudomonas frederiksbergensis]|uniref:Pyosin/cloacin translocation domain-containing protein n=2 Tax=Pseudomonas frederiksbergensis TaxID=104087 RepID=A0A423KLF4_9PSED|nr:hypothetical protein BK665_10345 [Pseudomonas frederiksbergensis]